MAEGASGGANKQAFKIQVAYNSKLSPFISKFSSEILSQIHFPQCYVFPQNNVHLGHCCTKNDSVILADFFLLSELVVSCLLT